MAVSNTQKNKADKLWSPTFVLLIVATFLANISANGMHNGVAVLLELAGSPASLGGFIVSAFAITALLARFVAGFLADTRGRKVVLYLGGISLVAGSVLAAVTTDVMFILPARILMGFGFSMCVTAGSAAAADIIPPSRIGEGMGYQGLAVALGIVAGPVLAISLAYESRMVLFGVFAVLSALILVFTFFCKLPDVHAHKAKVEKNSEPVMAHGKPIHTVDSSQGKIDIQQQKQEWEQQDAQGAIVPKYERGIYKFVERKSFAPALIAAVFYCPLAIYFTFMALYATQKNIGDTTMFFAIAAVFMIALRLFGSKMFDRFSPVTLIVPAAILGAMGFILPMVFASVPAMMVSGACYGLYMGVIQSVLTAESLRYAPKHRHGAASATFYIGCDVGVAIGAAFWGFTIAEFGWEFTFTCAAIVIAIGILLSIVLLRGSKPTR